MSTPNEEQEKTLIINRAYLLGLHYIQKAVVENIKNPEKVEEYKQKFFDLCDTALEDIFVASAKPEDRTLNLLIEINKERLTLLRYINDLKNNDSSNIGTIHRLEQYSQLSLQTYGQLITAYNTRQPPPILKKENIIIPFISKNFDVNGDNCNIRVFNFNPPQSKDKNLTYILKIYHETAQSPTEIYSGNIIKGSQCQTVFSGLSKFREDEKKLPRLLRSKFVFEIIQIKSGVLKKKEISLGEHKISMKSFENEFTVSQTLQMSKDKSASIEVELMIREPLCKPKERRDNVTIRISTSVTTKVRSATTNLVPEPTIPLVQPAAPTNQPAAATRRTTIAPSQKTTSTTVNVPRPTVTAAPKPQQKAKPPPPQQQQQAGHSPQQMAKILKYLKELLPLLPQEELDQFIDTTTIDSWLADFKGRSLALTQKKIPIPNEFLRQKEVFEQKKQKLMDDINSGALSIDDYKVMLKKQMDRNRDLSKKATTPMMAVFYSMSADNMKEQLDSFEEDE